MPAQHRFKVQTVREFMDSGPPIGSRKHTRLLAEEVRRRTDRLAQTQNRIDAWHARKSTMTRADLLRDEISVLVECEKALVSKPCPFAWLDGDRC